jgi:hypothetical protein
MRWTFKIQCLKIPRRVVGGNALLTSSSLHIFCNEVFSKTQQKLDAQVMSCRKQRLSRFERPAEQSLLMQFASDAAPVEKSSR